MTEEERRASPTARPDTVPMPEHEPPVGTRRFDFEAPVAPDAPRQVRWRVRGFDAIVDGLRPDFELLLTELVSNVVRHSGLGPSDSMTIRVAASPGYVWTEVSDPGRRLPPVEVPVPKGEPVESGFGFMLIDRIATRWGTIEGPGATVWFELREEPAGEAALPLAGNGH
jgi:hypothetical protein